MFEGQKLKRKLEARRWTVENVTHQLQSKPNIDSIRRGSLQEDKMRMSSINQTYRFQFASQGRERLAGGFERIIDNTKDS